MKKFIEQFGLIFFGIFLGTSVVCGVANAASFPDVGERHVNYDAVEYLKKKDIVQGYPDGTFGPDKPIKRSEAMKIIVKSFELDHSKNYEEIFSDVKKGNWFFSFVMAGHDAGFIQGYTDGTFGPAKQVKLSETLKIAIGAAGVNIPESMDEDVFADVEKDNWLAPYAFFAREKNIVLANGEGKILPGTEMTRGAFSEIVYRTMTVVENEEKEFPIYEKWATYQGVDLPFEMRYDADNWEIIKNPLNVIFFNPDEANQQFSSSKIYPNSAKLEVNIDKNEAKYPVAIYFNNIKELFPNAEYTEFTWNDFKSLEVLYPEERIVDWYIYLDGGAVLAVYTQYGDGPESFLFPQVIKAMLSTFKYREVPLDFKKNYEAVLAAVFANILVEGKGMQMLNNLPDKKIIETDSIGVGTGPVDYYYSDGVNHTFKYERAGDVILDKRQGKTSEF